MAREYIAKVLEISKLNIDTAYIKLEGSDEIINSLPGQFVALSANKFLKRPFGIASVCKNEKAFFVGIKEIGEGTAYLNNLKVGDSIEVIGPLGNGFPIDKNKSYILVGGGTGVFPINYLHQFMKENDIKHKTILGYRNKEQAVINYEAEEDFILTTDNGELGLKGNTVDALNMIKDSLSFDETILVVGPSIMMKFVGEFCKENNLTCYVSLEARMACGIGICLVCTCKTKAEDNNESFKHVRCCKDGPVFLFEEVIWDE